MPGVMPRKLMNSRPSGPYFPVCRSPVSEIGNSRGAVQVSPSNGPSAWQEDYAAMMLAGGRSPEGNRFVGEGR